VRTAGAKRTKAEIKRDYEYLQRLWEQIRELTLKSIAPAKIYEEGDLIKRSIRDLYNRDIDEVLVEGERGYRNAKDFMKMIMPSHAKNVKHYVEGLPLFARYQVESYLAGMFNPTVQLKSGGYIVIGVTEALVAVDVNSGRATKEGSIEETALKTNLEAADEVARQLRLRDLAGLIVIDFIDMDERKNNAAVEKRMKDRLKTDRARIQVGRISGFGLMEMSRQRLRPGMIEATTAPCPSCHGTGLIRSDDNMALSILRQIEEEGTRKRSREVVVKCPVGIANFLMNMKREHIAQIEGRYGLSVRIEGDPMLVSPDFSLEKFKTATRTVIATPPPVVLADSSMMDGFEDEDEDEIEDDVVADEAPAAETSAPTPPASGDEEQKPKRRRRRRRRRSKSSGSGENGDNGENGNGSDESEEVSSSEAPSEPESEADTAPAVEAEPETAEAKPAKPKSTRSRSRSKKTEAAEAEAEATPATEETAEAQPSEEEAPAPKPKRTTRSRSKKTEPAEVPVEVAAEETPAAEAEPAPVAEEPVAPAPEAEPEPEPVAETPAPQPEPEPEPEPVTADTGSERDSKPKKRGWWSLGSK
jgi:ribonuclease E